MDRKILGITLRPVKNVDIKRKTKIIDIIERIANLKW